MSISKATFCLLFILFSSQSLALDMNEGEWELVVKQNVSGMPVGTAPVHIRECFTEQDPIPTSFLNARSCSVLEQRTRHRTVYYKLSCFTEHGSVINEGKIRFSSFKISGDSKTDLGDLAGKTTVMRYKFTGRRVGECR